MLILKPISQRCANIWTVLLFDLTGLTTLKLPFRAAQVLKLSSVDNVRVSMPDLRDTPRLILGGGSNLVVLDPVFEGVVLRPEIKLFEPMVRGDEVILDVGAGMHWHQLVMQTLAQGWYGLENLALIPGWVGAAPVQNIGAYGVELESHCVAVTLYDFELSDVVILRHSEMQFGYRHSILKAYPDRFMVLSVRLRLSTVPNTRVEYGAIRDEIQRQNGSVGRPENVAQAVMAIRRSKLPDPDVTPNVGSFFKNPVVRPEVAERLATQFPGLPVYAQDDQMKVAAGWMIDQLGLKGFAIGGFSVHQQQALVLINDGSGVAEDLRNLVKHIRQQVKATYGLSLQVEPTQLGQL